MSKTELVSDLEIREGIYNHEVDGHALTRIAALGNAMQDAGTIHVNERRDRAFMREIEQRCKKMVAAGTLEAINGGWRLREPEGKFHMTIKGGECPDITYVLSEYDEYGDKLKSLEITDGRKLGETIGNLYGYRPEYVRRVILSSIVAGKSRTINTRASSLRFIIKRVEEES